jgi:RNA polymerase sigma-70 factor, ECF subfamily
VASLVRAAQAGDEAAFEALYHRFARYVHGVALARGAGVDADDVVQEVFLTAYRRLGGLREADAFAGWLGAIARTHALDRVRTDARRPESRLDDNTPSRATAAGAPDALADAGHVLGVIRSLPEAYRETLVLRLVEGMTGPEIAVATGLGADSVRVNLHRGMRLLRDRLGITL